MNLQVSGSRSRGVYSFKQPFHFFSLFGYICNLVMLFLGSIYDVYDGKIYLETPEIAVISRHLAGKIQQFSGAAPLDRLRELQRPQTPPPPPPAA